MAIYIISFKIKYINCNSRLRIKYSTLQLLKKIMVSTLSATQKSEKGYRLNRDWLTRVYNDS